jgi:long-chain acyl-CoA synthetase
VQTIVNQSGDALSPATDIATVIRRHAVERPDHPAIVSDSGTLTYGELDARSSRLAQALRAEGVGPGDRVAIIDRNGPVHLEVLFGAAKLGAIPAPVNFRLTAPEVAYILENAGVRVWVVGAEYAELAAVVIATLEAPPVVVVVGAAGERPGYDDWLAAHPAQDPGARPAPEDTAYLIYSSGTTGHPKGVELTHANVLSVVGVYEREMGLGADAVFLDALPLFHIGGASMALAAHLVGATNVLLRDPAGPALVAQLSGAGVTHAVMVPALFQAMLAVPGVAEQDYSSLQSLIYGASPISETLLAEAVRTFGCDFLQAYGMTEGGGTIVLLGPEDHDPDGPNRHRLRACGRPLPGVEIRLVDPDTGEEVPDGEVGELWVRGPSVMRGYWRAPEQTAAAIVDGWFRSGDLGHRDADGYLFLSDRVKDMIVSGGENIYPAEVENALASHPGVADVAVIAVPSERWGETPKAIVVRAPGAPVAAEELLDHCRERLARYKCPTSVEWADQLPRNPSGKLLKKVLRAPFWEGRGRAIG